MMSYHEKLNLNERIKNIKEKDIYIKIFKLSEKDINKYMTINNNGIFFDINLLNVSTLKKIKILLDKHDSEKSDSDLTSLKYTNYSSENISENLQLSTKEKNLIRKIKKK
jgi:hypothetical protein|tara:strand:- start:890 stop:1219 length:330 start_codon:yes stop_codon:yes gene_type:complete